MRRRIAVSIASVVLCLGGLVVTQAGTAIKTVGASGGSVTLTATVRNAKTCGWSSSPKIAGFNITVKCISRSVSLSARFKANATTQVKRYTITLTAKRATPQLFDRRTHDGRPRGLGAAQRHRSA